jgi:dihydroorotate dehydrogenase (NAD+) catalytic subunit
MYNISDAAFYDQIPLGKKKIRGRFVIPSGIRCAHPAAIERYFQIDSIGVITTKSISYEPKVGYREPLYAKYGDNSYINAVGLDNPGAEIFAEELSQIHIPENKFLLVSIFGGDEESFLKAARVLAPYADGWELNMSCPHAKGYGLQVGSDKELVARITRKIADSYDIPVFVKLSGTIPQVAQTAKAAMDSGAAGITITNTIGPGLEYIEGQPILSNQLGGISGEAIRPLGLKALYEIRQSIGREPVVIGMGGIISPEHIVSYAVTGADFFGIGSALTNLNTEEAAAYLDGLEKALLQGDFGGITDKSPAAYLKGEDRKTGANMKYHLCQVEQNIALTDTLHKIAISPWDTYDPEMEVAGKFFFLMIPGKGEKPFAVYSLKDREFIIKNLGTFTQAITSLKPGDNLYLRGPYGKRLPEFKDAVLHLVGGGTGMSPLYEIGRHYSKSNKIHFYMGGKTKEEILDVSRYAQLGNVLIATEDGSMGAKGFVTQLLPDHVSPVEQHIFINVGPKNMLLGCYDLEKKLTEEENIWASVEYYTSCGVGICGKCATGRGFLSCVDGPFLRIQETLDLPACIHL